MGIAGDLIYIVIAALIGGIIARLARQPVVIGYILAGVLVGPYTGGITVSDAHSIEKLAEIGVALLLFTLGLEFSIGELKRIWKIALLGTPSQLLLAGAGGYFVGRHLGFSWQEALWFGSIISLSSTMVVLKSLAGKDEQNSLAGKIMLGMLIAQDLAIIPIMVILPQVTGSNPDFLRIMGAVGKSAALLLAMYFGGTRILPKFLGVMARFGSRELSFLTTLAIALGIGMLAQYFGLSFALGAFVAGMMLSESDFNHQALSDVSGLRDLFGLLFFVSVGMLFDPSFFVREANTVILVVATLVACKAFATTVVVRLFGYRGSTPWLVGFGLSQIGEFAFLIASVGIQEKQLSSDTYSLVIATTVVSMALTPGLLWAAPRAYMLTRTIFKRKGAPFERLGPVQAKDHVVVIGGGMTGSYVARALSALNVSHVVVEIDYHVATRLRDLGQEVVYGDAAQHIILEAARVKEARLVIIAMPSNARVPAVVNAVKHVNSTIPVVVRADDPEEVHDVLALGVHEIVQPRLEAGLEMVRQALRALGSAESAIVPVLVQLRSKSPVLTKNIELSQKDLRRLGLTKSLEFDWIEVEQGSSVVGKSLAQLKIRRVFETSVVGIIRGEEFISNPGADIPINAGDVLAVLGRRDQIAGFVQGINHK